MNDPTATKEALVAAGRVIAPSVAYVATANGRLAFSGIFVEAKGYYFVLTARHCIEDVQEPSSLHVYPVAATPSPPIGRVLGRFYATSPQDKTDASGIVPRLDIGLLLLDHSVGKAPITWVGLDRLSSGGLNAGSFVILAGFPSDLATSITGHERAIIDAGGMFYLGEFSRRNPGLLAQEATAHVDLFIEYNPVALHRLSPDLPKRSIRPHGLSGCGVFAWQRVLPDQLWTLGPLQVVAVQSAFLPRKAMLRATRSEFARRAIQDVCSELDKLSRGGPTPSQLCVEPRPMPDSQV